MQNVPRTTVPPERQCRTCRYGEREYMAYSDDGEHWAVCDRCRRQAERLRCRIRHEPLLTAHRPTRPVEAATTRVGELLPDTSHQMAAKAFPRSGTLRRRIVEAVLASRDGLTDYQLEEATGRTHQSVSSARNGLVNDSWLVNTGRTRMNRHGNEAIVWGPTPALREEMDSA